MQGIACNYCSYNIKRGNNHSMHCNFGWDHEDRPSTYCDCGWIGDVYMVHAFMECHMMYENQCKFSVSHWILNQFKII